MASMCISCGWTPDDGSDDRDVIEYVIPGRSATRNVCTECLEAASGAWVLKSLPQLGPAARHTA